MKKILLTMTALLASASMAFGQNALTVPDITLPQNSDAMLTVNFQFDVADAYTGYSFVLDLPADLEFVLAEGTDVAVTKGSCHDASHSITANLDEGLVKVAGLSLSSKPLTGTSGTLLTFTIKPAKTLTVGQTFTGTIKDIIIVPVEGTKQNLASSTFTVTIGEPADLRTVLDEISTTAPSDASGVDVRVKRTIKANEWSTICLPFAMAEDQVKAAFGDDVKLGNFSSWSSEEDDEGNIATIEIGFTDVDEMEANHPYIIKTSSDITDFTADGVDIEVDDPTVQVGKKKAERGYFIGTYVASTTVPENNLFLSGNNFWYSAGKTKMKAFRGYFELADVLTSVEEAGSRIILKFNDETTGISSIDNSQLINENSIYDLHGRRVEKPAKGIYVKKGKKYVVK